MALEKLKILVGIIAIGFGIPVLISPIGVVGHFGYIIGRIAIGLTLVLGGTWAVWINWPSPVI